MRAHRSIPSAALAGLLLLGGCFNPKLEPGFQCGEADPGPECPKGFFCARNYTCQSLDGDGDLPATGDHYPLGQGYPGFVAARLGDGVAVAGWVPDALGEQAEFHVWLFDKYGEPLDGESEFTLARFRDVDRASLRAAGSDRVAVIAGHRKDTGDTSPHLVYAWLTSGTPPTVPPPDVSEFSGEENQAITVTANEGYACHLRTVAVGAGAVRHTVSSMCHSGTGQPSDTDWNVQIVGMPRALSASISSVPGDLVALVEIKGDVDRGPNRLRTFCLDGGQSWEAGLFQPVGDSLRPHVFADWDHDDVWVTWQDGTGLCGHRVNPATCGVALNTDPTCFLSDGNSTVQDYDLAGRSAANGFTGSEAELWSVESRNTTPLNQSDLIMREWQAQSARSISVPHDVLTNPRAVTLGDNNLWYFVHASDADDLEGWVKLYDPRPGASGAPPTEVIAVGADDMQVTADYAVAPRQGGGFFLVYRHWTDDRPESINHPLDVFLAPIGPDLGVLWPP
ncbi:MAG: hypothetical protein HY906_21215 [Deltaproteobacteria bacterium]|nr:hypothetical protein [Deltaproteobacteria bacterium]